MVNDSIGDLLIRIKNGYLARLKVVITRHSNIKEALAHLLEKLGYVGTVELEPKTRVLTINLRYSNGLPVMVGVKRVSKPGLRRYFKRRDLDTLHEVGHMILSTPKGLKTHQEAKREGIGGEVVCIIW